MKIIVQREPSDSFGVDVIDPLLSSVPAGMERGRSIIELSQLTKRTDQTVFYRPNVKNGDLISMSDSSQGATKRGITVSTTIKSDALGVVISQGVRHE